ncbi:DUF3865 domain-containing protein [Micromonospora aurantiaca]|uniref:DUF3865 domain-containing protein n=1 Tax=Micromonospora aurantiaca (nom. illeg.) TaxID=47850 RepID=UPI000F3B8D48|nr:DUF3865 domain-containing protein [Micromonospora aurantiaca]RNH93501.1 DUF3865 domain-containing protein [Micromonospora aurantiaca]
MTATDALTRTPLVENYLSDHPETRHYLHAVLMGKLTSGDDLITAHLAPMINSVYQQIRHMVDPGNLNQTQAHMYIAELAVFARYNAQFLRLAADTVAGYCPELAHELRRNYLEEGGERGKIPAHYILYTRALLADLGLLVNGHVPADETAKLVLLHQVMVNSHMPSVIAGGYYATEGVAIAETEILRDITDRYGQLTSQASGQNLPALDYYYRLHLDDEHEAAQIGGLSVEAAHIEGLAQFIRNSDRYGLDLPQAVEGFLQIFNGMTDWWTQLAHRARNLN